jgi:hypothetical protein
MNTSVNVKRIAALTITLGMLAQGCGEAEDDGAPIVAATAEAATPLPDQSFIDFLNWTPVLDGDKAFKSKGHGGILVRSYLNPTATEHARAAETTYPMPEGSVLAKAVISSQDTPSTQASRVYFMRKEAPGFDPENCDWSYAQAKRVGGKLVRDTSVEPRDPSCVSCHVRFKQYDFVQTVEFFKRQSTDL